MNQQASINHSERSNLRQLGLIRMFSNLPPIMPADAAKPGPRTISGNAIMDAPTVFVVMSKAAEMTGKIFLASSDNDLSDLLALPCSVLDGGKPSDTESDVANKVSGTSSVAPRLGLVFFICKAKE